jgi:hypothetical protein
MRNPRRTLHFKSLWVVLCLVAGMTQGCARRDPLQPTDATGSSSSAERTLPFHQSPDQVSDDSARPAVPTDRNLETGRPFHGVAQTRTLPPGTLITVRLDDSLSLARIHPGDAFTASVAGPLTLHGEILVESGVTVSGRVEAVQPSANREGLSPDPGYVRLTLNVMTVDGRPIVLRTSSLFAKGTFAAEKSSTTGANEKSDGLRVLKGRRLTFRLTAPITFADPRPVAHLEYPYSSNQ